MLLALALFACHRDDADGLAPVHVDASGPQTCADPDAREAAPYDLLQSPEWDAQAAGTEAAHTGGGLAVGDLDDDGLDDVFLPQWGVSELYFGTADGGLRRATEDEFPTLEADAEAASLADYDGDGDLDLFVGVSGQNRLYQNDAGRLTDVTVAAGLAGSGATYTFAGVWADMDGDEDLDLFVANHAYGPIDNTKVASGELPPVGPSVLYANRGDGTFADVSERLPASVLTTYNNAAIWTDKDADGDQDLYVIEDFGPYYHPNVMLENDGTGHFTDSSTEDQLGVAVFGMGVGAEDTNLDGRPDFIVSGWDQVLLLESAPDGRWYDAGQSRGLLLPDAEGRHTAWGVEQADLDNDGDLDAMVVFGPVTMPADESARFEEALGLQNPTEQPDGLWLAEDGLLTQAADAWGLADPGAGRGLVLTDLDGDGGLDLLRRDVYGVASVALSRCSDAAWLEVAPRQPGPNRFAIGAIVEITGSATHRRAVVAGNTISAGGPPEVHVGLGEDTTVDVSIRWPDGARSVIRDVPTRQRLVVTRE